MTTKLSRGGGPSDSTHARPESTQGNALSSLLTASHLITSAPDEAAMADAFAHLMQSFDVDFYSLVTIEETPEPHSKLISSWDRQGRGLTRAGDVHPLTEEALRVVRALNGPLIVEDYEAQKPEGNDSTMEAFMKAIGARAFSHFPLIESGKITGLLAVFYNEPHPRSEEEVQSFSLLAQLATVARLNMAARAELARKVKQVNDLYRIGEALAPITDEDALLRTTASLVASEIHYVTCWIGLVDEDAGVLREAASSGAESAAAQPPSVYPLSDRSVRAVSALLGGHPVAHSVSVQERAQVEVWGRVAKLKDLNTTIFIPLRAGGDVLGVMAVGSSAPHVSEDEVALLGAFGNQLASAMARLRMNKERSQQVAKLKAAYVDQARLLSMVRELSTPVIPVHDGVLVLPLVGVLDASRGAMLMESLLNAIQKERASVVILDVTGVPEVDADVANSIVRSVRAAALLGAQCVLVGVSPAVSQTMVELRIDLGELVTRRNLQSGISYAISQRERARAPRA